MNMSVIHKSNARQDRIIDLEEQVQRLQQYAYILEVRRIDDRTDIAEARREAGIQVGDTIGHDGDAEDEDWWSPRDRLEHQP